MRRIQVIDSHTAGEPTRLIVDGGPALGAGSLAERLGTFRELFDGYRSAVVNEPRGSDVMVGGLLCEPDDVTCAAAVIFFNNVGYLGMCGHGTIGLIATLAHMGRLRPGVHRIQTPVGVVSTTLHEDGSVSVANVASYRKARAVEIDVPNLGKIRGDVAWGGNWFFLSELAGRETLSVGVDRLTTLAWQVRRAVNAQGFAEVDHVELFGPPAQPGARSRSFVLCPGGAYDRSPCGTGTSAKLACLAADDKLAEGDVWVQESIIGTTFEGTYRWLDRARGEVAPTIKGRAYVNAESTLLLDENDPFCFGIPPDAGRPG